MSKGQSKMEQLIHLNSYKKHKQLLDGIKVNKTSRDFNLPAKRYSGHKGISSKKGREGSNQNSLLKDQLSNNKNRTHHETPFVSINDQLRYEEDDKLDAVVSGMNDEEPIRLILPSHRNRTKSFLDRPKPQIASCYPTRYRMPVTTRPESSRRNQKSEREIPQNKQRQNQMFYHLPERNEQRQVVHNKTVLLSPTQSCFYQLSLIGERMLIAAHIMGVETYCLTELLSVKRTGSVVRDYEKNYERLFTKISLEEGGKRYQSIRVNLKEGEGEEREREKLSEEEVSKNRLRVQNHFIQRNYYSSKKEEQLRSEGERSKPTITHEKMDELMERLAAPKRYLIKGHDSFENNQTAPLLQTPAGQSKPQTKSKPKLFKQSKELKQTKQPKQTKQSKKQVVLQSKLSIHIDSKETEQRREKMQAPSQKSAQKEPESKNSRYGDRTQLMPPEQLKSTDSFLMEEAKSQSVSTPKVAPQSFKSHNNSSQQEEEKEKIKEKEAFKKKEALRQKEQAEAAAEEVEYLDGEDDVQEENYEQEFQNPSTLSKPNGLPNKSNLSQPDKNNSLVSAKSKKSSKEEQTMKISKNESKQYEDIYEDEYQNEEMVESEVHAMPPRSPAPEPPKKEESVKAQSQVDILGEEGEGEEYLQQFDN